MATLWSDLTAPVQIFHGIVMLQFRTLSSSTTRTSLADTMRYQSKIDTNTFTGNFCYLEGSYDLTLARDSSNWLRDFRQALEAAIRSDPESILATTHPSLRS